MPRITDAYVLDGRGMQNLYVAAAWQGSNNLKAAVDAAANMWNLATDYSGNYATHAFIQVNQPQLAATITIQPVPAAYFEGKAGNCADIEDQQSNAPVIHIRQDLITNLTTQLLARLIAHELGHRLGLANSGWTVDAGGSCDSASIMEGYTGACITISDQITAADVSRSRLSEVSPQQCDTALQQTTTQCEPSGGGSEICWLETSSYYAGSYSRVAGAGGLTCADIYETDYYRCSTGRSYIDSLVIGQDCIYEWPYCLSVSECGDADYWSCDDGYCNYHDPGGVGGCNQEMTDYCHSNGYEALWDPSSRTCLCGETPILVDIEGGGVRLSSPGDGVVFDLAGNGHPARYSWPEAGTGTGFLVLDRNANGMIDDGSEMFGNASAQPDSAARNGFVALREFDKPENGGNSDGVIDSRDAVFPLLRLWFDENRNGVSESQELHPLGSEGIVSISLNYKLVGRRDRFGNAFRYRGQVERRGFVTVNPAAWDVILVSEFSANRQ